MTPPPPGPRLNVAIATYDRLDLLERTLESLACARRPEVFERVLVVENGSGPSAREVCARAAREIPLEYHHVPASGKSRAMQWAVERLKDGFVLFFDDDVRVGEGVLEAYANATREHGRGNFFGGPLHADHEEPPPDWLCKFLPRTAVGWAPEDPTIAFTGEQSFLGPNYGAFVEDVIEVGGFRADIGPGALVPGTDGNPTGQEFEMQTRLVAAGLVPVYVADAAVWHYVPRSRCSPEWALHRVFRHKQSQAMLAELESPTRGRRVRDVPVRLWSELAVANLRAAVGILDRDPRARFDRARQVRKRRGQVSGCRLAAVRAREAAANRGA